MFFEGKGDGTAMKKTTYAGLFMVTLATLMYEILLTRIFSVTMWYHFAFLAISIALFGMTVGAVLVYLFPKTFSEARARLHLALSALAFALTIVLSFLAHLRFPQAAMNSPHAFSTLALTYTAVAVPFVFSGILVCLALTKFPRQVGKLYAADLAGAALGCVLLVAVLNGTDGPTAVVIVAVLAGLGSFLFALEAGRPKLIVAAAAVSLILAALAGTNLILAGRNVSLFRLVRVKGAVEPVPLLEKWNSYSRIQIYRDPEYLQKPFGWGFSSTYTPRSRVDQLGLKIDANAFTVLTRFDGDLKVLDYLRSDVINIVHYLRPRADVLAIGAGGGRDVLSALVFDQKSVLGVEINQAILKAVNKTFGDFTGHLDRNPRVRFINDEARSYITRTRDKFDIIQSSLIDTWAATAAGAFALSENSLYTVEAWTTFFQHLKPGGVVTFSRWYQDKREVEVYRLTALASTALVRYGVDRPRAHILIIKNGPVGTLLAGRDPFSEKDLQTIEDVCRRLRFEIILSPRFAGDATLAALAAGRDLDRYTAGFPQNISAPTDDNPYFFMTMRLGQAFKNLGRLQTNPVPVLAYLFLIVTGLTVLGIIIPLVLTRNKPSFRSTAPLMLFFAGIGFGFMMVEVSQMQRLIIFLGHPTYSLSVVLFVLLLSSSLGSLSTNRVAEPGFRKSAVARLMTLVLTLGVFGALTPLAIRAFQGAVTPVRILVAVGILAPIGLLMGMAFPLGMRLAAARSAGLTPWLWGVNGSTSVWASVTAIIIAMSAGISASFWTGVLCYLMAVAMFALASRPQRA
jgi:predicted membrane-bound spermidine synthase